MMNNMEHVTGLNRKSVIRILNGCLSRRKLDNERGPTQETDVIDAAMVISLFLDHSCAELLKPSLVLLAKHLSNQNHFYVDENNLENLESIITSMLMRALANNNKSADKIRQKRFSKRKRN